eukprot:m.99051 g.99051  ORF g.99051 m.99051 type:complete len:74 (-) comp10293_c2_seq1:70-291(-)
MPIMPAPSTGSKIALAAASVVAGVTVWFVHKQMSDDRASLRQGVIRDIERQRTKREAADGKSGLSTTSPTNAQ